MILLPGGDGPNGPDSKAAREKKREAEEEARNQGRRERSRERHLNRRSSTAGSTVSNTSTDSSEGDDNSRTVPQSRSSSRVGTIVNGTLPGSSGELIEIVSDAVSDDPPPSYTPRDVHGISISSVSGIASATQVAIAIVGVGHVRDGYGGSPPGSTPPPPRPPRPPSSSGTSQTSSSSAAGRFTTAMGSLRPATNNVYIRNANSPIKGEWVINPCLAVPDLSSFHPDTNFLPFGNLGRGWPFSGGWSPHGSQPDEEERRLRRERNLWLESRNGVVCADVTLVERQGGSRRCDKATLFAKSTNGSVDLYVHDSEPRTVKLKIQVSAVNGNVKVKIPRSFRGVVISTAVNGRTKLSEDLRSQLMQEQSDGRVSRLFVGEYREDELVVDELSADTRNGSVSIQYDDEVVVSRHSSATSGFWRLFG